jgi:tRNA(His) guanylyltransferase
VLDFTGKDTHQQGFINPKTNKEVLVTRRELFADFELPMRDDYNQFISEIIERNAKASTKTL